MKDKNSDNLNRSLRYDWPVFQPWYEVVEAAQMIIVLQFASRVC
jgi:hypothetical protein